MINKIYDYIKKNIFKIIVFLLSIIIILFMYFYEFKVYIYTPGGLINLNERIKLDNNDKTSGDINMSYVSVIKPNLINIIVSKFIKNWDMEKINTNINSNKSLDDIINLEKIYLKSSIDNAIIYAYKKANKDVKILSSSNIIVYISDKSDTDLKINDEIIKVNNIKVNNLEDIKKIIEETKDNERISVEVKRDNDIVDCYANTFKIDGITKIGISTINDYEYLLDPNINIETKNNESGSSGGFMLSLAIYNLLTDEDITKGKKIAGTGTIDTDGNVGKIDGIKYKLLGASKENVQIFFVPKDNYDEAINIKNTFELNMDIYKVEKFDDCLSILESL